jgi:hypothetical protein
MRSQLALAGIFALALAAQPLTPSLLGQDTAPPPDQNGASAQSGAPGGEHQRPRRPLPKPVNLQVLPKDTPPEQLIKIMRGFAGSLGVECEFCHARNPVTHKLDFPSDANPDKTIARTMIAMTQTINGQFMTKVNDPDAKPEDKQVKCGTCHRGHSMPEQFVPPPEHHGPPGAGQPGAPPQGTPPPTPQPQP